MYERGVELRLSRFVGALGGWAIKLAPTVSGLPDRLVLMPGGKTYLVELKTTKGRLSKIQIEQHKRLEKLGFPVQVLYGESDVDKFISWLIAVSD